MAELNGVNAAKRKSDPASLIDVAEQGGRLRMSYDIHSVAAAQNDTLVMGIIPKGARVYMINIIHGACGTSSTLEVGVKGGANDLYATGYDNSAAGSTSIVVSPAELAADTELLLTFEGAAKAAVDIEAMVFYSLD